MEPVHGEKCEFVWSDFINRRESFVQFKLRVETGRFARNSIKYPSILLLTFTDENALSRRPLLHVPQVQFSLLNTQKTKKKEKKRKVKKKGKT